MGQRRMVLMEQRGVGPGLGERVVVVDMAFAEAAVAAVVVVVAVMVGGGLKDHKACLNETENDGEDETWEVQIPLRPQILRSQQVHFQTPYPLL